MADWKTLYDDLKAKFDETHERWMSLSQKQNHRIDQLLEQVEELKASMAPVAAPPPTPEKRLGARERDSLLKLIIGMAVEGYRYDPDQKRSDKISDIVADLEKAGVALDADTVRKWLKEAAGVLPPTRITR